MSEARFTEVFTQLILLDIAGADRHELIADAAAASAGCLHEAMAASDEPPANWEAWLAGGHMRKSVRKASCAVLEAAAALEGSVRAGRAVALAPELIGALPSKIRRTQVSGWSVGADPARTAPDAGAPGLHVVLEQSLQMSTGKACAQAAHAAVMAAEAGQWAPGTPVHVHERTLGEADTEGTPRRIAVRDAGLTEVAAGSLTCVAYPR